jgi:hypothetical protein
MIRPSLAVLGLTLALGSAGPARACSCAPPPDAPTALAGAHAVFQGTVVAVALEDEERFQQAVATFSVSKVWKGPVGRSVEIRTSSSSASCGWEFQIGAEYVVYAYVWPQTDLQLRTHLCTRTHAAYEGDPDPPLLGTPSLPTTWGALKATYR